MAFIPQDAEWYVVEVVSQIRVGDDPRIVTHVDTHLVHASSPDDAHEKALGIGAGKAMTYVNPAGARVAIAFLGLRELLVVHDDLEDGAELWFDEHVSDSPEVRVRGKHDLAVFARAASREGVPDYSDAGIMSEVAAIIEQE